MKSPLRPPSMAAVSFWLVLIVAWGTVVAEDDSALARHLIRLGGRAACPRGICAVPEDGPLALEIAKASEFVVVSQELDDVATQQARRTAYVAGVGGRRLYVAVSSR